MDRAQQRHKLRVAWARGGRCSGNCARCCVVREFLRKSVSKRFTPRWLQVSCGVRVAGFRRQKPSSSSPSRKPGGSGACWEDVKPKMFRGWTVSYDKTLCAAFKMQVEPSLSVAQSVGGCVWMGGTRGSERRLPSWACCSSVAKR